MKTERSVEVHSLKNWSAQLSRYSIFGIASNVTLYILYLFLTHLGMGFKVSMSVAYFVGMLQAFYLNRRWTFNYVGNVSRALTRYAIVQLSGYLMNLLLLIIFVDRFGFAHQIVQAAAIVFVALFLFILLRLYVFPNRIGRGKMGTL